MIELIPWFEFPADLASCPCCRCVVTVVRYVDGSTCPWDPKFGDRRLAVSTIGMTTWIDWLERGQRWGLCYDRFHECPPPADVPAEKGGTRDARIF